jgi:hypothetical protein
MLNSYNRGSEYLTCRKVINREDFLTYPCASSKFGIYKINGEMSSIVTIRSVDILQKVMVLPIGKQNTHCVCIPLIGTDSFWQY